MTKDELEVALKAAQACSEELEVALNTAVYHKTQLEGALESVTEQLNEAKATIELLQTTPAKEPSVPVSGGEFPKMLYYQGSHSKHMTVKSAVEEAVAGEDWWDSITC